jgi:Holliday junction DNA helicase RuvA
VIAKLRRKVPRFALLVSHELPSEVATERDVLSETFDALRALGHSESESRRLLDEALSRKKKYKDVDELLRAVYEQRHGA